MRTFASSFQFPDEFLFCTDKIESIELPSLASILLVLSLLLSAGCCEETSASCDEDVGEVGEDEHEELVDRPGTTNGT